MLRPMPLSSMQWSHSLHLLGSTDLQRSERHSGSITMHPDCSRPDFWSLELIPLQHACVLTDAMHGRCWVCCWGVEGEVRLGSLVGEGVEQDPWAPDLS